MKDPFPLEPVPWLSSASTPLAKLFNLPTLPLHIHEVVCAALFYSVIFWPVSPLVSRLLAPGHYPKLSRKKRLNWDAHVVSLVQSSLINAVAIWVMFADEERAHMTQQERVWGYTGGAGLVQALAAGYFLWDLVVTSLNFDVFGPGTLAHAIAALVVYSLGFRPFLNYYSSTFILWELSTPFLNVHWFMDKVDMTGSRAQLYNGLALLTSFFACRLVYGTYQSYCVFTDYWAAIDKKPSFEARMLTTMGFTTPATSVPLWLASSYLLANLTLNFLNFYWFVMMIRAVRKRFVPSKEVGPKAENEVATEVGIKISSVPSAVPRPSPARRRKA